MIVLPTFTNKALAANTTNCSSSFVDKTVAAPSCQFGDSLDEVAQISENTDCFNNPSAGKVINSWQPDKTYICAGEGVNKGPEGTVEYTLKGVWVTCNSTGNPTTQTVMNVPVKDIPWLSSKVRSITYSLKSALPSGCQRCSDTNGNGYVSIDECPGFKAKTTVDECVVTAQKNCTYGTTPGKTCGTNSQIHWIRGSGVAKVYACSGENKGVECDPGVYGQDYSQIFTDSTNKVIKNTINCRFTPDLLSGGNVNCTQNTVPTLTGCTFGPYSTGSTTYRNCAESVPGEGEKNVSGKFQYCGPDNNKYQCDTQINYNSLFGPNTTGTGAKDYTGKTLTSTARSGPYNCKPLAAINCNVQANLTEVNCAVPENCFNGGSGVKYNSEGDIFCISDGGSTTAGKKYICKGSFGTLTYSDVATKSGGVISLKSAYADPAKCMLVSDYNLSFPSTSLKIKIQADYSPVGLLKTISNFLFYVAILYFVLLMLSNGYAYVRAAEDPGKLKEIKASLFNTIAGFLFVLLSGGLIISLINQIGL